MPEVTQLRGVGLQAHIHCPSGRFPAGAGEGGSGCVCPFLLLSCSHIRLLEPVVLRYLTPAMGAFRRLAPMILTVVGWRSRSAGQGPAACSQYLQGLSHPVPHPPTWGVGSIRSAGKHDDNIDKNKGLIKTAATPRALPAGSHILTHLTSQPSKGSHGCYSLFPEGETEAHSSSRH